jgi:hypothetical protein
MSHGEYKTTLNMDGSSDPYEPPVYAYPHSHLDTWHRDGMCQHVAWKTSSPGMTLRDWFAGHALAGMIAEGKWRDAAQAAYQLADEMLKAREVRDE